MNSFRIFENHETKKTVKCTNVIRAYTLEDDGSPCIFDNDDNEIDGYMTIDRKFYDKFGKSYSPGENSLYFVGALAGNRLKFKNLTELCDYIVAKLNPSEILGFSDDGMIILESYQDFELWKEIL